jgi:hypothetical protein
LSSSSAGSETDDFAAAFTNAVHGGLDKVLGQSGTAAVLSHLQMSNNLPDPAEFHKKLLALFGAKATLSLERAIVKDLIRRLKWALDLLSIEDTFDFNAIVRSIQTKGKNHDR